MALVGAILLAGSLVAVLASQQSATSKIMDEQGKPFESPIGKPMTDIMYQRQLSEKNLRAYFCSSIFHDGTVLRTAMLDSSEQGMTITSHFYCEDDSQGSLYTSTLDNENNNQLISVIAEKIDSLPEQDLKLSADMVGRPYTERRYETSLAEYNLEYFLCEHTGVKGHVTIYDMIESAMDSNGTISSKYFCKSDVDYQGFELTLTEDGRQTLSSYNLQTAPVE